MCKRAAVELYRYSKIQSIHHGFYANVGLELTSLRVQISARLTVNMEEKQQEIILSNLVRCIAVLGIELFIDHQRYEKNLIYKFNVQPMNCISKLKELTIMQVRFQRNQQSIINIQPKQLVQVLLSQEILIQF